MKRLIFSLLLFFNFNIYTFDSAQWEKELAELDIIEQEPVCSQFRSNPDAILVSLGYNCYGAMQIQKHGYRIAAYPFDWGLLPLAGLNSILQNNFAGFCDIQKLKNIERWITHELYKFSFVHDFESPNWQTTVPKVREKYQRRIQRFHNLANYTGKIYFIHCVFSSTPGNTPLIFNYEEVLTLQQNLRKLFPTNNFELILIFYGLEKKYDWASVGIRDFYIHERNPPYWKEPTSLFIAAQFGKIFESLGFPKIPVLEPLILDFNGPVKMHN